MRNINAPEKLVVRDVSQAYLIDRIAQQYVPDEKLQHETAQAVRKAAGKPKSFRKNTYRGEKAQRLTAALRQAVLLGDKEDYTVAAAAMMLDEHVHPEARNVNDVLPEVREAELEEAGAPVWTEGLVAVQALRQKKDFSDAAGREMARIRMAHDQDPPSVVMEGPDLELIHQ